MKTKASIKFGLIDITAKQDSQLSVNDKQNFVYLSDLKSDSIEETKYGTCEKNQFVLDGTFGLMPQNLYNMCLWSNMMSGENGVFETPLVLTINFSEPHTSSALTLVFSEAGDYCNSLNLKYYNKNNTLIKDLNFEPDNYKYICNGTAEKYSKIVITFNSTNNPYRYLKLYKILYGAEKVFEGDNLISANLLEEIDLLSSELSINTLDFTVHSDNDDFNIINPQGIYSSLQKRQKLEVTETLLKENKKINMGTLYLTEWKNKDHKTMEFKAQDILGFLDTQNFYGGFYDGQSFMNVVSNILLSAGLGDGVFNISDELADIEIYGHIQICTCRQALQQVAFVAGAIVDCSRSSKINFYKLDESTTENLISKSNIFQNTRETEQTESVNSVAITTHKYEKINSVERENLCTYTFDINVKGTYILQWDEPAFDVWLEFQNAGGRVSGDFVKKQTSNSLMIDFDRYSQISNYNELVILALAAKIYHNEYGQYPPSGYELQVDGQVYNNMVSVVLRNSQTTYAQEYYDINLGNRTVTSDKGYSGTFTVEDMNTTELSVSVYGKKYKHTTTVFKKSNADEIEITEESTKKVENVYLINSANVEEIANRILDYYSKTFEDSFELILNEEKIAQRTKIETDYEQKLIGNISRLDIDLTGGFLANTKMINRLEEINNG